MTAWTYDLGLAVARREGMAFEFKESYACYRAGGDDEAEAVRCALYDWDILPADDVYEHLVLVGGEP